MTGQEKVGHLSVHLYGRKRANAIAGTDSLSFSHNIDKCPEVLFSMHMDFSDKVGQCDKHGAQVAFISTS